MIPEVKRELDMIPEVKRELDYIRFRLVITPKFNI